MKSKPIESTKSWPIRVPVSTVANLKKIQAHLAPTETNPSYSRLVERAVNKMLKDLEKKA